MFAKSRHTAVSGASDRAETNAEGDADGSQEKTTVIPQPRLGATASSDGSNKQGKPRVLGEHPASNLPVGQPSSQLAPKLAAYPTPAWITVFCSADPALWNSAVGDAGPRSAFPADLKYLKVQAAPGKYVIIEVTREQLDQGGGEGRYRWYGGGDLRLNARQLGIYDATESATEKGQVSIIRNGFHPAWGFGIRTYLSDAQGYGWGGKEIEPSLMEIAVTRGPLTPQEQKHLLK
jgi:hypothetical protein